MPGGMPYHLEKGPTLGILEDHLNRADLRPVLTALRTPGPRAGWLNALPGFWTDARFNGRGGYANGAAVRDDIIRKWFGYTGGPPGSWTPGTTPTTGYWIAYHGDVDEIVRRGLIWAIEVALRLGPGEQVPAEKRDAHPIELFWKCPAPWFETWVVRRPAGAQRAVVTVVFVTPSHLGGKVASSPLATSPTTGGSPAVPSTQDDYEVLDENAARPVPVPTRPRVPARMREHAMWVITHEKHMAPTVVEPQEDLDTAAGVPLSSGLRIPQFALWANDGPGVVNVAPSMPAGGVHHNGIIT